MNRRITKWTLLGVLVTAVAVTVLAQAVNLDLGAEVVVMTPNAKVALPLTLSASGEGPVKVTLEIAFPTGALTFIDAAAGTAVDAASAKLKATKKEAAADAKEQTVTLEIDSPKPLSSGSLASLNFSVNTESRADTEIHVRQVSRVATTAGGQKLEARGAEGLITLVEAPQACFFYMH